MLKMNNVEVNALVTFVPHIAKCHCGVGTWESGGLHFILKSHD